MLLNQYGAPLLIDQPEDDVDSKISSEIMQQLWKAKSRRQLIFASHNANFVVNGDAELVVCCDYVKAGDQTCIRWITLVVRRDRCWLSGKPKNVSSSSPASSSEATTAGHSFFHFSKNASSAFSAASRFAA